MYGWGKFLFKITYSQIFIYKTLNKNENFLCKKQ